MASTIREILAANGIKRPDVTVRAAQAAGLELAAACVMLMKESGGGRMVWGSDGVSTGGIYTKGGPVTRESYLAYCAAMKAGQIGRNGVGDCQLTSAEYQDRGDALGGCWDPYANQLAGFTGLARLIAQHGERGGFKRYNGSGAAAERYAADAMTRLKTWRTLLAGSSSAGNPIAPQEFDVALSDTDIEKIAEAVWSHAIRNGFGDTVAAEQILTGAEKRTAEILDAVKDA